MSRKNDRCESLDCDCHGSPGRAVEGQLEEGEDPWEKNRMKSTTPTLRKKWQSERNCGTDKEQRVEHREHD